MSTTPPRQSRALSALAAFLLPLAGGVVANVIGEDSVIGALLLFLEPVAVVVAIYLVLRAALARRPWLAGGLALGWALGIGLVHLPPTPVPPPDHRPDWTQLLRTCATNTGAVEAPVRVVQWTLPAGAAVDPATLVEQLGEADVAVLHGPVSGEAGTILATAWGGEAKSFPPPTAAGSGATLVVRGAFQYCGGTEDSWAVDLPSHDDHGARVIVTFPRVEGAGTFPLLAVQLDGAHGPTGWPGWPRRLADSGRILAALVQAIGPAKVVLVGDLAVPPNFRNLAGRLSGAGLTEARVPPSWPAGWGPLPLAPVHRLDRVWHGAAWIRGGATSRPRSGASRVPVRVTLQPATATVHRR
ncbi:MAG: hypothetical protein H6742_00275 [Alphaproteobacteria bacterium]|nr:hypothetical protein [Alphaproteobacteria bacterium]